MNDLIGILLPLLMSGAGITDIFRAIGGARTSSAGMDGLNYMIQKQISNARLKYPLSPDRDTINRSFSPILSTLGIDPNSGGGQGAAALLGGLYHIFPNVIGSIAGIPNGGNFFGMIANGAPGISAAAGFGRPDMFNPYSMMESFRRTRDLSRMVYDMGVRKNGGYNIDFGHGLNMDEMGKVTQRLLSSSMTYVDENGNRLDPESKEDADKFKERLNRLGSKFNEAASMLSKVTGSVDEALALMDRLGGGNFLGGTEEQASAVANKARKMATSIRIAAAMGGISPQDIYDKISAQRVVMSYAMGIDPEVAKKTGFSSSMYDASYSAIMGYGIWAAANPKASETDKDKALFVARERADRFSGSSAAKLVAAVADNRERFTPEQLKRVEEALRTGRANDVAGMVKRVLGSATYTGYMNDPSMNIAAIMRINQDKQAKNLYGNLFQAGIEGNITEAERLGTDRIVNMAVSDVGRDMYMRTGKSRSEFTKESNEDARAALVDLAVKEGGFKREFIEGMKPGELKRMLTSRLGADKVSSAVNRAKLSHALRTISQNTMSSQEEENLRGRLIEELESNSVLEDDKTKELLGKLRSGADVGEIVDEYTDGWSMKDRKGFIDRMDAGKYSRSQANKRKFEIRRQMDHLSDEYTSEERITAIENRYKKNIFKDTLQMKGFVKSDDVKKLDDKDKLAKLESHFMDLEKSGKVSIGGEKLEDLELESVQRILNEMFDGKVGDMEGDDLKKLTVEMSSDILNRVKNGDTFKDAYKAAASHFSEMSKVDPRNYKLGDAGRERLKKMEESTKLDHDNFLSAVAGRIDELNVKSGDEAMAEIKKLAEGKFGDLSQNKAADRIFDYAKRLGIYSGKEEDRNRIVSSGMESIIRGTEGISQALGDLSDGDIKDISAKAAEMYMGGSDMNDAIVSALKEIGIDEKALSGLKKEDMNKLFASGMIKGFQPKGIRGGKTGGFNAAVAAGKDANLAALNSAAIDMLKSGMDLSDVKEFLKDVPGAENVISHLDDVTANGKMNPFSNAIQAGGGVEISRAALKDTEKRIGDLGKALKDLGINKDDLEEAYGKIDTSGMSSEKIAEAYDKQSKKREAIESKLKDKGITGIGASATIKAVKDSEWGLESLFDENKLKEAKSKDEKGYEKKLADITKQSAREDSAEYKALKTLGDILEKIAPFIMDPKQLINGGFSIPVRIRQ